ncbi:hypothetical protein BOTBODRAFT_38797 [Botryobasidium botryosum FD-172 SS1]|uniref:Uncharacterized protein n=1 Tax=Botryobasidium botryosum (strain FD-172 SS1) TaxID=930990 RepID=A0A067LWE1_BOTB1|nr:hypothetical protein BOTBODRAFT_38797 [Botryobasidium botryosum FD-172 SS1]
MAYSQGEMQNYSKRVSWRGRYHGNQSGQSSRLHRATLTEYGPLALDLVVDHTRCLRDVLFLSVAYRAEAARTETSFFLAGAEVVPLEALGEKLKAGEVRGQLQSANEASRRAGLTGSFGVVVACPSHGSLAILTTFCGFAKRDLIGLRPGMAWKEGSTRILNEAIVL